MKVLKCILKVVWLIFCILVLRVVYYRESSALSIALEMRSGWQMAGLVVPFLATLAVVAIGWWRLRRNRATSTTRRSRAVRQVFGAISLTALCLIGISVFSFWCQPWVEKLELRCATLSADGFQVRPEGEGLKGRGEIAYKSKAGELAQFRSLLQFRRTWSPFAVDAPYTFIEFTRGTNQVEEMVILGGEYVEWHGWPSVYALTQTSQKRLLTWLAERGVAGPQAQADQENTVEQEEALDVGNWLKVMPPALKPYWPKMAEGLEPKIAVMEKMNDALAKAIPSQPERIRTLLAWYGSGKGPWTGFPAYEEFPEAMLENYQTMEIITACQGARLTPTQTEGAARYFAGWNFSQRHPQDRSLLPDELRRELLDRSLQSADKDKLGRARKAFGAN